DLGENNADEEQQRTLTVLSVEHSRGSMPEAFSCRHHLTSDKGKSRSLTHIRKRRGWVRDGSDRVFPHVQSAASPHRADDVRVQSIETRRSSRKSLSIFPVPSTTEASGSSAMETGKPVSSRMRLSRFLMSAPPPVRTMPRSLISAESSGGVRSSATRIAFTIVEMFSESASRISLS